MAKSIQIVGSHLLQVVVLALLVLNIDQVYGDVTTGWVNITILSDAVAKGAVCLDGSPAGYHYSKGFGDGKNNWIIYLPGGGWCSSTSDCLNRVRTSPSTSTTTNINSTYFGGIMSSNQSTNPDFYNWNIVYLRYCDGSSFTGDVETVDPKTNLHYRGSRIFSAVVEELLTKGLQNAQNVILAGNSAGGLATILNCDRFKAMVPNCAKTRCISDSGFFILAKDLPNADHRESEYAQVVQLHCFFPKNLVGDVETPLFILNSAFDLYQITFNLKPYPGDEQGWASCTNNTQTCTPGQLQLIKDFRNTFLETVKNTGDCPSRGLFIDSCYIHDHLWSTKRWSTPILNNKTVAEGVGDWFFDRSSVKMIDTQVDRPINCHIS
ncbi:pectinacetylesterase family protein [Striga asiatica]|uniref:Pectin acetylesterase n=1 Tax=Striga asiatica TaxID=4170 RepID=A0A5A7QSI8_STRAF|nr:pectinacetylesterase family protein [Striga asiatica]